jgi:hypothetical protein
VVTTDFSNDHIAFILRLCRPRRILIDPHDFEDERTAAVQNVRYCSPNNTVVPP